MGPGEGNLHDVPSGLQETGREEAVQIKRLLGPSQGSKWPQTRREPGVEDVFVADPGLKSQNVYRLQLIP